MEALREDDGVLRYAKGDSGGRWVTIGAVEGEDGKKHGGSPVFIDGSGRITKGHPSLAGKKIGAFHEPAESGSHRQELQRSRDYERSAWGKRARKAGLDPKALHQLASEVLEHDRAFKEGRTKLLRDTRELLTHYGYDARALTTNLRSGHVEDRIPRFDLVARTMAERYPEHFQGMGDDPDERLRELLTEGNPAPMSEDDAYSEAFNHLESYTARPPAEEGDAFEPESGGELPPVEDDTGIPFARPVETYFDPSAWLQKNAKRYFDWRK